MDIVHGVAPQKILERRQAVEEKEMYLAFKRIFDFAFSLALIILFLPFMALIALVIKITSNGPVIFKQKRIGMHGKEFICYKFRSMYVAEHNDLNNFASPEDRQRSYHEKKGDDPRITPFGKYIRKTSIDELPQLFNVLIGDMSLVGPRPMIKYFFAAYPYTIELRSVVKPGMTGLWQVRNRANSNTIFDMLDYDLEYIENISLITDMKILFMTIPTVIKGEGAV